MLNFSITPEDDQMVPQLDLDSWNSDVPTLVAESTNLANKGLTDLDSLLADITNTIEKENSASEPILESSSNQSLEMETTYLTNLHMQTQYHDEMTFYEDQNPFYIKKEKVEDISAFGVHQHQHKLAPVETFSRLNMDSCDTDLEGAKNELQYSCAQLGIPMDPYTWTEEQVRKWAMWTLEQYRLPINLTSDFVLDGPRLCMLSEDDFRCRWPQFGPYLFAQLEFFKSAYSFATAPNQEDSFEDQPIYTDLSNMDHHHHTATQSVGHQDHQQMSPSASHIPASHPYMSPSPMYSTPSNPQGPMLSESHHAINIPKPVFSIPPNSLSPAPSVESIDSSSSFSSSPASYTSEDVYDQSSSDIKYGGLTPTKQNIHLWQFLRELLLQPRNYGNCIRWLDRTKGIFKIEDSARVARLWGMRKNRPAMNYDKLSRSIRQYYKKGIIKKTDNSKRLVYQFCTQYRV